MQKWSELLPQNSLQKAAALSEKAQSERDAGQTIYPPQSQIFRALELTPPEQVRAVIVGQDPYHGPGQANVHNYGCCRLSATIKYVYLIRR